jgi:hypothetical protein
MKLCGNLSEKLAELKTKGNATVLASLKKTPNNLFTR